MSKFRPTSLLLRFFRWYCHPSLVDHIEGDLMELYRERLVNTGKQRADILLFIDIVLLIRPAIIRPIAIDTSKTQNIMIGNYVKVSWRNISRNRGYSAINIGGLAIGMAVAMVLALWVYDELSFNRYFTNYDRLGHVMVHNGEGTYPSNPIPLAAELRSSFSEDLRHVVLSSWMGNFALAYGERNFLEQGNFMQSDAAEMLGLKMISGSRSTLKASHTILISQSLSEKLFGNEDPINKVIRLKNLIDVTVGGVYEDFPFNTEFHGIKFIGSWDFLVSWMTWMKEQEQRWDDNSYKIYVQLMPGADFKKVSNKIKDLKLSHLNAKNREARPELFILPMSDWHLHSKFISRKQVMSEQMEYILFYVLVGAFVLVLACINFTNLSTARSQRRSKEVGIRKSMGSLRKQLIVQFFTESLLHVLFGLIVALIIVLLALPWFNQVADKSISIPWSNLYFWLASIGFILITGFLAGFYPALYLSSFKPIKVLKGIRSGGKAIYTPRRILVVIQFSISVMLIIGTIVVSDQIQFGKRRSVGYHREGLVSVYMITPDLYQHYDVIRDALLQSGAATSVATSSAPVTDVWSNNSGFDWKGKDPAMEDNFATNQVAPDYGNTLGWRFIAGRDFNSQLASDSTAIIINQSAVKYMGLTEPVGQIVKRENESLLIIGVVEDIVMQSPFKKVLPTLFFLHRENSIYTINIRLNEALGYQEAVARMSSIFRRYNPSVPFDYNFVDDEYEKKFKSEEQIGSLVSVFSTLAIVISCLGLYGLASFVAEQRTKELGIRKVVGATVFNLWSLLSKDFVVLVTISCLVAFPTIAWFLIQWLERYEYKTEISWWIFPLVGLGTVALTLSVVSYQAIRAAMINPVQSLKSE